MNPIIIRIMEIYLQIVKFVCLKRPKTGVNRAVKKEIEGKMKNVLSYHSQNVLSSHHEKYVLNADQTAFWR